MVADDLDYLLPSQLGDVTRIAKSTQKMNVVQRAVFGPLQIFDLPKDVSSFNEIFIGDITILPSIIKIVKNFNRVHLRLHNLYSRIFFSRRYIKLFLAPKQNFKFIMICLYMTVLEMLVVFLRVEKIIVVSNSDRLFLEALFDRTKWLTLRPRIEVSNIAPAKTETRSSRDPSKLVWFGGTEQHKLPGLKLFVSTVFLELAKEFNNIEFHLFGNGTQRFSNHDLRIFGHGFWSGKNLPFNANCLFIIPDTVGLGVKIKIVDLVEAGAHILTTPEGLIGYEELIYPGITCLSIEDWRSALSIILSDKDNIAS